MTRERASIFASDDAFDVSAFAPKAFRLAAGRPRTRAPSLSFRPAATGWDDRCECAALHHRFRLLGANIPGNAHL